MYCTVWLLLILRFSRTRSAMLCYASSHTLPLARNRDACSSTLQPSSLLPGVTDPHSNLCSSLWWAVMRLVQFIVYYGCSPAHFLTSNSPSFNWVLHTNSGIYYQEFHNWTHALSMIDSEDCCFLLYWFIHYSA
jgi:hypothetical protein